MKVANQRRTTDQLRAAFSRIQEAAAFAVGKEEWRVEVDKIALQLASKRLKRAAKVEEIQPSEWLKAAETATVECPRCHGSGVYRWGACVNGRPPEKSGPCFACGSKGRQGTDDFFRNRTYWRHVKVV